MHYFHAKITEISTNNFPAEWTDLLSYSETKNIYNENYL